MTRVEHTMHGSGLLVQLCTHGIRLLSVGARCPAVRHVAPSCQARGAQLSGMWRPAVRHVAPSCEARGAQLSGARCPDLGSA